MRQHTEKERERELKQNTILDIRVRSLHRNTVAIVLSGYISLSIIKRLHSKMTNSIESMAYLRACIPD